MATASIVFDVDNSRIGFGKQSWWHATVDASFASR